MKDFSMFSQEKIQRIEVTDEAALQIPDSRVRMLHQQIRSAYHTYLQAYGVKPLWQENDLRDEALSDEAFAKRLDRKELQLIFLYNYAKRLVHKDAVSAFVRKYYPDAALDQQVRHLGSQYGWYVLNKGNPIPDTGEKVPSGYNYLVSIETPNPKIIAVALKRAGRLAARNFEELKIAYGNKCATCGIAEGIRDIRDNTIVSLQQGHMDPRKPLSLKNTIPQCGYCNQTYQDYFCFNEYGRVISVNNPIVLLQSSPDVRDEMIEVLMAARYK